MPLAFHIDGKQVRLNDDWEMTSTAAGGYEQLTATADRDDVHHVHQGSRVTAFTDGGVEVWTGTIDATPATSRLQTVHLTATGPVSRLRRMRADRLYQSRDYGMWKDEAGDPYGYDATEGFRVSSGNGLMFSAPDGQPFDDNSRCGLAFWGQNENISRIAFTVHKNRDTQEFNLLLWGGSGPTGSRTLLHTFDLGSGTPDNTELSWNITGDYDMITLELVMASGAGTMTVLSSAARTTNGTGAWQALPGATGRWPVAARCSLFWTAHSGTTETLAVEVDTTGDTAGGTPRNRGTFDQKAHAAAASGSDDTNVEGLGSAIRATWTIAGGGSPSWTFYVLAALGYRKFNLTLSDVRVNGRWATDEAAPGDIIADMASSMGLDTKDVRSSGQNALPFYWEGGSWADAIDELAALDDWPWRVTRDAIVYDSWQPGWHLQFAEENEDLDFPPVYNRVRVFYTTLAGAPRSIRVEADPDPLARFGVDNEYQYDLGQSYSGDDIPTAVANALLEQVSTQQVVGNVQVVHGHQTGRVWTPKRRFSTFNDDHYRIVPGQLAYLTPYPDLPPQRIASVRLRLASVEVGFGTDVEASAARTLARIGLRRSRSKPKKH
jgi:hypothetical protein